MASPFPGMDPFLEDPIGWRDFHTSFLPEIRKYLQPLVIPRFHIRIEERVYITDPVADVGYPRLGPDLFITRSPLSVPLAQPNVAMATIKEPAVVMNLLDLDLEIHDSYLEIRDARTHAVVTAIEVLSPSNKVAGSHGRDAMMEKRRSLRRAGAHIIEIDLLRAGHRDESVAGRSDYCVTLLKNDTPGLLVWDIDLRDELPTIAVPLDTQSSDVALELQKVFTATYEGAAYDFNLDYTRPVPPPMLRPADAAWVEGRLKARLAAQQQAS